MSDIEKAAGAVADYFTIPEEGATAGDYARVLGTLSAISLIGGKGLAQVYKHHSGKRIAKMDDENKEYVKHKYTVIDGSEVEKEAGIMSEGLDYLTKGQASGAFPLALLALTVPGLLAYRSDRNSIQKDRNKKVISDIARKQRKLDSILEDTLAGRLGKEANIKRLGSVAGEGADTIKRLMSILAGKTKDTGKKAWDWSTHWRTGKRYNNLRDVEYGRLRDKLLKENPGMDTLNDAGESWARRLATKHADASSSLPGRVTAGAVKGGALGTALWNPVDTVKAPFKLVGAAKDWFTGGMNAKNKLWTAYALAGALGSYMVTDSIYGKNKQQEKEDALARKARKMATLNGESPQLLISGSDKDEESLKEIPGIK